LTHCGNQFASLIKLSKSQNNDAAQELAAAVAKREAQQAAARAEAAAREAREREAAKERLKRRFDDEQKAKQRAEQEAELAAKRERELDEKREREARAMLAGKPAASASRARTTGGGENSRPRVRFNEIQVLVTYQLLLYSISGINIRRLWLRLVCERGYGPDP
jgi:hypothetical protein